jgi:serine/threonine protein kinase
MAELYLARARGIAGFEKVVALKRVLPKLAEDPEVVTMFLDEARLAASLHHPNLAQVYDIGKDGGSHYFTMEYIHGEDLGTVVQRAARAGRGLSLSSGLFIVTQVAAGLHHAHDKKGADGQPLGTVHRDVSPSNVMITFDGAVKIVDFGVAKAAARRTKTLSGSIKGKFGYLSPEQARGEEIDRRSDVFALGILLFELTTGTRLFDERHDYAVLTSLLTKEAPLPSSRLGDYPPELEEIVLRALRREPSERYDTAQDLQIAIEDFAREHKLALSSVALGRFMREVVGEREDPTLVPSPCSASSPTGPAAKTRSDRGRSAEAAVPETLSGAASQPAIPLERGVPRPVWLGAGAVLLAGALWLTRPWDLGHEAPDGAAGAVPSSAGPLASAAPSAPVAIPSAAAPEPASATASAPSASSPPPGPPPFPRPPTTKPRASASVVDSDKGGDGDKPTWNPGSVLPPVVEDKPHAP